MPPEFLPPEFSDPGRDVGNLSQTGAGNARIEAQLNQPADVSQAHQFFQPRVDSALPTINLGDGGASLSAIPNGIMPGGEHALTGKALMAGIGAENAALGALAPGAEQGVSPLIQMILKMPGLTGFMSDFFDFLKALFEGDLLQSLTAALLDPTGMMLHLFQDGGGDFLVPVETLNTNMTMFKFDNGMFMPSDSSAMRLHTDLLDDANVGAPIGNVDLQDAIFEKTSGYTITDHQQQSLLDWRGQNTNLALGPDGGVYRPTTGSYQAPAATSATNASQSLSQQATAHHAPAHHAPAHHAPAHHPAGHHHGQAAHHAPKHFKTQDIRADQVRLAHTPTDAASGQYTVQPGDSLWDIAKNNLGDGSRWSEIYKMNADAIGQNPDLIHPGTTLQMPDSNSIASAAGEGGKYIVQPGDNLWNISQQHMGGGANWGELYRMNQGVIGSNPGMIHPGQELTLGGSDASTVASTGATAPSTVANNVAPNAISQQVSNATVASQAQAQMGALQAETPQLAPIDNSFASAAQVGNETIINSGAQVPATDMPGAAGEGQHLYTSQDGSLFYRNKPQ